MAATVNKGYTQCVGGIDKPHANNGEQCTHDTTSKGQCVSIVTNSHMADSSLLIITNLITNTMTNDLTCDSAYLR